MAEIILSRQQELVLAAFEEYKRLNLAQLSPFYTQSENLKLCLIRLTNLGYIKMCGPGVWEYCGPDVPIRTGARDPTLLAILNKKEEIK
jgi:hypothetical protein